MGFMFNHMYNLSGVIWIFVSGIFKVASNAETAASTYEVSMWRALWNDLFSQVHIHMDGCIMSSGFIYCLCG